MNLIEAFGADHGDLPLLQAVAGLVGQPVRVRSITPHGDTWARGAIERVTVDGLTVVFHVIDEHGDYQFRLSTDSVGHVQWSCPRRRTLVVYVAGERQMEIHDDSAIRIVDDVERDLTDSLAEPDPIRRHERLDAIRRTASRIARIDPDRLIRRRLRALAVFLEEYRTPTAHGREDAR